MSPLSRLPKIKVSGVRFQVSGVKIDQIEISKSQIRNTEIWLLTPESLILESRTFGASFLKISTYPANN
jgi:hypothetical protein